MKVYINLELNFSDEYVQDWKERHPFPTEPLEKKFAEEIQEHILNSYGNHIRCQYHLINKTELN